MSKVLYNSKVYRRLDYALRRMLVVRQGLPIRLIARISVI